MTQCAIVAGASGALGAAITLRLRAAGLEVIAIARTGESLSTLFGSDPGVRTLVGDLEDDSLSAAISEAVDDREVRMVVQAAGLPLAGTIDTITGAELMKGVDRKIGGFLRLIRGAQDRFVPGTRLVVLGGHYGYEPTPAAPLAGVTNAAIANLVRSLADRWGPEGVTVHLVAPGPVDSPRMTAIAERIAERRGGAVTAESVLDEYRQGSPLGRLTTIDEVAWAVATLLQPEAACLHGSTLSLDLGRRRGIG